MGHTIHFLINKHNKFNVEITLAVVLRRDFVSGYRTHEQCTLKFLGYEMNECNNYEQMQNDKSLNFKYDTRIF